MEPVEARTGGSQQVGQAVAGLAPLIEQVRPVALAGARLLPVLEPITPLLPEGGLRRGTLVEVGGGGATSLALALAAGASASGSWVAAVGLPSLGLAAAGELGVALHRLALVPAPGSGSWATVVATAVDAVDVVLVRPGVRVGAVDARRLVARARERGAVLLRVGGAPWVESADVVLDVLASHWVGLGTGHGHLRARRATVAATGRRGAARPRRVDLWLPGPDGRVATVEPEPAAVIPLRGVWSRLR